jgi:hypothetical protein
VLQLSETGLTKLLELPGPAEIHGTCTEGVDIHGKCFWTRKIGDQILGHLDMIENAIERSQPAVGIGKPNTQSRAIYGVEMHRLIQGTLDVGNRLTQSARVDQLFCMGSGLIRIDLDFATLGVVGER